MNFNMNNADPLAGAQHADVMNAKPETDEDRVQLVAEVKSRGNAAFKAGLLREACALYTCAIVHDPKSVALWGNRSMTNCGMGQFQLALDDALKAIEVDPKWAKGYFRKGMALNGLKLHRDAWQAFQKSLELEPSSKVSKREAEKAAKLAREDKPTPKSEPAPKAAVVAPIAAKTVSPTKEASSPPSPAAVAATSPAAVAATAPAVNVAATAPVAAAVNLAAPAATAVPEAANAATPNAAVGKTATEEEVLGDEVRGYRVLADGRKTTFFNMERTEEEKALIGDIRPKRIDPNAMAAAAAEESSAPKPISAEKGASAWNAGGTFEERDMNEWAKNNITERVQGLSVEGDGFKIEVAKLEKIEGDASITFARGRKRHVFDFELLVNWEATLDGDSEKKVTGKLFFMDFNGDTASDEELDVELRWEQREKAGKYQTTLRESVMTMREGGLRRKLNDTLLGFITEFRALQ